jgi:hypothetical protein
MNVMYTVEYGHTLLTCIGVVCLDIARSITK